MIQKLILIWFIHLSHTSNSKATNVWHQKNQQAKTFSYKVPVLKGAELFCVSAQLANFMKLSGLAYCAPGPLFSIITNCAVMCAGSSKTIAICIFLFVYMRSAVMVKKQIKGIELWLYTCNNVFMIPVFSLYQGKYYTPDLGVIDCS